MKRVLRLASLELLLCAGPEIRAYYQVLWHLGGSRTDIAELTAEDIDWKDRTISYRRGKTDRGPLVKVTDRQSLQPPKNIATHVVNDVLFKEIIDEDAQAVEQVPQEERPRQPKHRQSIARTLAAHPKAHFAAYEHHDGDGRKYRQILDDLHFVGQGQVFIIA